MPAIGDSLAQDLRKLPAADRPAVAAARIIAANEAKIAEYKGKDRTEIHRHVRDGHRLHRAFPHISTGCPSGDSGRHGRVWILRGPKMPTLLLCLKWGILIGLCALGWALYCIASGFWR